VNTYRQSAPGHARRIGAFAQDAADDGVAVGGATGLTLARALVVARAQGGPASKALGAAEARHVVTDLDEDQCRGDLVDARDGLQQLVRPGIGLQRGQHVAVDLGNLALQRLNVGLNVAEHEQGAVR
jgi:hypothetical protein